MTEKALISVHDAVHALAFVGDLSMGRQTDHSHRTGWLAAQIAAADGCGPETCRAAVDVALLRWSGCTANASGFDRLLGDDVGGREKLMAMTLPMDAKRTAAIKPLAEIHCEVSGDIAVQLGMGARVEAGLRSIFESWDGSGQPGRLSADRVPPVVYQVSLASDFEILSRANGPTAALATIRRLTNKKYPASLVGLLSKFALDWTARLDEGVAEVLDTLVMSTAPSGLRAVSLELIGDVADLKLPWLAGQSRCIAECAAATASRLGLDSASRGLLRRSGLVHAMGRAAVPNHVWERTGRLLESDWERIRLVPYWTCRAAGRIPGLRKEAELASRAYERLDGSGYYRTLPGAALTIEQRVLATAVVLVALTSPRPWRTAHGVDRTVAILREEVALGRLDGTVVEAAVTEMFGKQERTSQRNTGLLSAREVEVLRQISQGESNKEVARTLGISASTVRTHIESIFRKLECSTRAAATLKAFSAGLL